MGPAGKQLVSSLMLTNDYLGLHNLVVPIEMQGYLALVMLTDPV